MTDQKTKKKTTEKVENKEDLLVVIRISGLVKVSKKVNETLDRLRLRRKYACVLVNPNDKTQSGMLKKVKFFVAFGGIDKTTLTELIKNRAEIDKSKEDYKKVKINAEKFTEEILKGKGLFDLGLKPFFRLHPPRKGIKSKLHYPKGVLGNNKKDINKLILRML